MLQIKTYLRYLLIGSFLILLPLTPSKAQTNSSFAEKSKGRIYLQVQSKGEAWYVNPADAKRYFLGRPAEAFEIMRTLGIGITNADLEKISKGDIKNITSSKGNATEKFKGKIYLQVQSKGEAWYVNPADSKRYYLGRPTDAFNIMRTLGIGITNADLEKITKGDIKSGNNNPPSGDNSLTAIDNLGNDADSALNNTDSALSDLDNLDENEDTIPALVQ